MGFLGKLTEDLIGNADVDLIIGGGDPEPYKVGAVLDDHFLRSNGVSE